MTAIDVLARGLLQSTVQGSVAVLVVLAICRVFPRLPAGAKCALWWVASAKLLISLAAIEPIGLPIVPAGVLSPSPAVAASRDQIETLRVYCGAGPCSGGDVTERSVGSVSTSKTAPVASSGPGIPVVRFRPTRDVILMAIVGAWLLGAVAALVWLATRARQAKRIVAAASPAQPRLQSMAETLAAELGLRTVPDIRVSPGVQSPQALGVFRPTVLLPEGRFDALTPDEQRMALCHELVHVKRGDLWLAWLPALAERICFFNPLAHVAAREYLLAREAACDADVLRALDASPQAYGRLLLALGIGYPAGLAAAGASRSVTTLTRRLSMLAFAQSEPARTRRLAWTVVAVAACALLPLRLAARAEQTDTIHSPSGSQSVQPAIAAATPSGAAGARAVIAPSAPVAAATAALPHIASGGRHQDAWVLLRNDDHITMSGDTDDVANAKRQRRNGEPLLWIRRDGREYVIRDAAVIKQAQQLFEPVSNLGAQQAGVGQKQAELGAEQAKIGAQQAAIGAQQGALGAQQGAVGAKQAELAARQLRTQEKADERIRVEQEREEKSLEVEMEKLDVQMRELGKEMEALNQPMEELSKKMEPLSEEQETLSRQMEKLSSAAENGMKRLVDETIANGTAEAVH